MSEENNLQKNNKNLKLDNLRTYTSDMAEAVRTNEASVIKIALAEKKKKEREQTFKKIEGSTGKKIFWLVAGVVFITVAILGSYYAISKKKERENPKVETKEKETLISYDSKVSVDITLASSTKDVFDLIKSEINKFGSWGNIKSIFLTTKIDGVDSDILSNSFFSLTKLSTPATLIRSLSEDFMIGGYYPKENQDSTLQNKKSYSLFLIFKINDYNQAYASILSWEKSMISDLSYLFNIDVTGENNNLPEKPWGDLIINNKDARVLYDNNGNVLIYYLFVNKNYLVITESKEAINEIISRIVAKNIKSL